MDDNRHYGRFKAIFADHTLTLLAVNKESGVEVWRLAKPGTISYSADLAFTTAGIAIFGDVRFGNATAAVCHGYGRKWFGESYDAYYIGSKFGFGVPYSARGARKDEADAAIAMIAVIHETFRRLATQAEARSE